MKSVRNREYSCHMGEKNPTDHQYFLSKQKIAEHWIFLLALSLNTLTDVAHIKKKIFFMKIPVQLPAKGRSVVAALLLLVTQSFMGVHTICKKILYIFIFYTKSKYSKVVLFFSFYWVLHPHYRILSKHIFQMEHIRNSGGL